MEGCGQAARTLGWCDSHYAQTRRTGRPPEPFKYKWSNERRCVVCGIVHEHPTMRKYCSARCSQLAHRGALSESQCVNCGELIDCAPRPGQRKRRSSTRRCARCWRIRRLRAVRSGGVTVEQVLSLGNDCAICGEAVDFDAPSKSRAGPSLDHITPTGVGGSNAIDNVQLTHTRCNQEKNMGRVHRAPQSFYWKQAWRNLARAVRVEEPNCRLCGALSFATDHIIAIGDGGAVWDRANLQALCRLCHLRKSKSEYRARCEALV